jgi:UDP-2,3-diacylglucosamine pyrophosphatase LpxH
MNKFFFACLFLFPRVLLAQDSIEATNAPGKLIAFTSDTQAPMWVETIVLKSHNNKAATKRLFSDIEKRQPNSLFILGDVVNLGYSDRQWRPMDRYIKSLREKGIAVHAALGNHEVMGRANAGQRKFQMRFPNHVKTGYVEIVDSVAIVILNSNFNKLSPEENELQVKWYQETLKKLDSDSSIHFIISGCHHSPYTNSKIVGCSQDVQDKFVKPFLASEKSRLFLSGHCHGFEHYKKEGKDFLVIGGGGGLNQPLRQGEGTLDDLAREYKPLFHYLTILRNGHQLDVKSYMITKDYTLFEEGRSMAIKKKEPVSDLANSSSSPGTTSKN